MEGLLGHPVSLDTPRIRARREQRIIQRWIAFLFLSILALLGLGWLSAAAFSV